MTRREALGLLLLTACGGRPPSPAAAPAGPTLRLGPAVDLLPAAGLVWLLDAQARELLASPDLIASVAALVPEAGFDAFARRHGGVDLRRVDELAVGGYPDATLAVARAPVDPARVEAAFVARALSVDGRAVEGPVVRSWGTVGRSRQQIAVLGREGVALEEGRFGPLRAAEYFALGKLHRASPALRAEPLKAAAELLGDAPLRAFAPGPFEGRWARAAGGLLGACTAVAASARPVHDGPRAGLSVRCALLGAWGADADVAARRLQAAFQVLTDGPLGRVLGLDRPLQGSRTTGTPGALWLEVTLDVASLATGLHAEAEGTVEELMTL